MSISQHFVLFLKKIKFQISKLNRISNFLHLIYFSTLSLHCQSNLPTIGKARCHQPSLTASTSAPPPLPFHSSYLFPHRRSDAKTVDPFFKRSLSGFFSRFLISAYLILFLDSACPTPHLRRSFSKRTMVTALSIQQFCCYVDRLTYR